MNFLLNLIIVCCTMMNLHRNVAERAVFDDCFDSQNHVFKIRIDRNLQTQFFFLMFSLFRIIKPISHVTFVCQKHEISLVLPNPDWLMGKKSEANLIRAWKIASIKAIKISSQHSFLKPSWQRPLKNY